MNTEFITAVNAVLDHCQPEGWSRSLAASGFVQPSQHAEGVLTLTVRCPFAAQQLLPLIQADCDPGLLQIRGVQQVTWHWQQEIATLARATQVPGIAGVRNIIAVASGKGGVGKSTVAVNLALALKQEGAKVGLLDADIYGPSVPWMLGCQNEHPSSADGKTMLPVSACGVVVNSIGFLVPESEAVVWRGPMASKALQQILNDTRWGELDYLVVDMPPGTGDIQLTLAQQVPTTAVVMVTTPQDIALLDVRKGIAMFNKVGIPVAGIVENMSLHICSQCGHSEPIFGHGGGEQLASELDLPLLGQLPLHLDIRLAMDAGAPLPVSAPDSEAAGWYASLARTVAARLFFSGSVVPTSLFTVNVD